MSSVGTVLHAVSSNTKARVASRVIFFMRVISWIEEYATGFYHPGPEMNAAGMHGFVYTAENARIEGIQRIKQYDGERWG